MHSRIFCDFITSSYCKQKRQTLRKNLLKKCAVQHNAKTDVKFSPVWIPPIIIYCTMYIHKCVCWLGHLLYCIVWVPVPVYWIIWAFFADPTVYVINTCFSTKFSLRKLNIIRGIVPWGTLYTQPLVIYWKICHCY